MASSGVIIIRIKTIIWKCRTDVRCPKKMSASNTLHLYKGVIPEMITAVCTIHRAAML